MRKESSIKEAERLGLPYSTYLELKDRVCEIKKELQPELISLIEQKFYGTSKVKEKVVEENLQTHEKKLTQVFDTEPASPEDIMSILKIDTSKWVLKQYWAKQRADGLWTVSALVSKLNPKDTLQIDFLDELSKLKLKPLDIPNPPLVAYDNFEKHCAVLNLQDLHFGKANNENIGEIMLSSIRYMINCASLAYNVDKLYFILGPDTLNSDTFDGTTTKLTKVENCSHPVQFYMEAFSYSVAAIQLLLDYVNNIEVIFIPGNHDRLSSYHLLHAISLMFNTPRVTFDITYEERKVRKYGSNMLCFEHGDVTTKNDALVYASDYSEIWGEAKYRYMYTGDKHHQKESEFRTKQENYGYVKKMVSSLTNKDYYTYHNKFGGSMRSTCLDVFSHDFGMCGDFIYNTKRHEDTES
jgi:hypothetical protein